MLARIDSHSAAVEAPPETTWRALIDWTSRASSDQRNARFAALLGADHVKATGVPGEAGSTFPGFRIVRAEAPSELALEGRHRFSDYRLDFEVSDRGARGSTLRATTHANFPGFKGQLYKTLVIRSRAHVLATKRLLDGVRRRAEREGPNR